jgi:hypothetical protein
MTASGIGDAPERQEAVRGVTVRLLLRHPGRYFSLYSPLYVHHLYPAPRAQAGQKPSIRL